MTAPDKIWIYADTDDEGESYLELITSGAEAPTDVEYTRTDLAQAAVAAAYEAAAQVCANHAVIAARTNQDQANSLLRSSEAGIRALATPDQIAALAAERAATVVVNPLVWVKSHMTPWRDDWHTVPTAYTIRCCDENGWKWQGNGGHGYESSAKYAMTAVQGIHEAAIRSAITITSGASPDTITLPRAEVEALMETLAAIDKPLLKIGRWMDMRLAARKAITALQEYMK